VWKLLARGSIKINFDGSKSFSDAATGFVIHSWQGNFIMVGSHFMEKAPILVTKATTMRDGIKVALQAG